MQANLPDINSAYIKYRNKAFDNLDSGHYHLCYAALDTLNAMLEEPYCVKIDTKLYREKTKLDVFYKCQGCGEETIKESVQIFHVLIVGLKTLISNAKTEEVWVCSKCGKENELTKTEINKEELPNPVFFGVVPEAPQRTNALMSDRAYHLAFTKWATNFLKEIEHGMKKYRSDYKSTDDEVYDSDIEIDEKDYD